MLGGHEHIQVLLLQFQSHVRGYFFGGSGADDGRESGGRAVHEFDASFSQNDVVRGAQPEFVVGGVFRGQDRNQALRGNEWLR